MEQNKKRNNAGLSAFRSVFGVLDFLDVLTCLGKLCLFCKIVTCLSTASRPTQLSSWLFPPSHGRKASRNAAMAKSCSLVWGGTKVPYMMLGLILVWLVLALFGLMACLVCFGIVWLALASFDIVLTCLTLLWLDLALPRRCEGKISQESLEIRTENKVLREGL